MSWLQAREDGAFERVRGREAGRLNERLACVSLPIVIRKRNSPLPSRNSECWICQDVGDACLGQRRSEDANQNIATLLHHDSTG